MHLEVLYEDNELVAINKPHGLLVHRTSIATNASQFAVQELRNQIGQKVHPVHRLDRKTSGVILFAKDASLVAQLQGQFAKKTVRKKYWAILRGYSPVEGLIDYDLTNNEGKTQSAQTQYKLIKHTEIDLPFGKFNTSRYSWVEAEPLTGRMHQLRKHFAHILHPIIGDRPHGCNKQNKLFLEKWGMSNMLLHARSLTFEHPLNDTKIEITAPCSPIFLQMLKTLDFLPYKE
jgi:tRNA pseudouridine65 synthase